LSYRWGEEGSGQRSIYLGQSVLHAETVYDVTSKALSTGTEDGRGGGRSGRCRHVDRGGALTVTGHEVMVTRFIYS
jgi:hypothetical protein